MQSCEQEAGLVSHVERAASCIGLKVRNATNIGSIDGLKEGMTRSATCLM